MFLSRSRRLLLPFALVTAVGLGGCGDEVTDRANEELEKQSQSVQDEIKKQSDSVKDEVDKGREKLDEARDDLSKQADELRDSVPDVDPR